MYVSAGRHTIGVMVKRLPASEGTHRLGRARERTSVRIRSVLDDAEVTRIDDASRRRFYDLLLNPPEPTDALKKLLALDTFRVVS